MKSGFAAVIGGVNVDIGGRSFAPLIARDSNPGRLSVSLGGVGRNVAHNLALLGVKTELITALGGDIWAEEIRKSCSALGIGLSRAVSAPGEPSSTYLYISGPDGDMALALCDMDIIRRVTPEVVEKNLDLLNSASLVVIDGNLPAETVEAVCSLVSAPIFADPVSVTKAEKFMPVLSKLYAIKPNALEAEALTGETVPIRAAEALVRLGVKAAFVSDGARGMAAADKEGSHLLPAFSADIVNATGGGDAAMAAIAAAYLDGIGLVPSARFALAAGAVAVESRETINPAMSRNAIAEKLEKSDFGGKAYE